MLHKIGIVIIFGTVSIIITAFIGVNENGIYSNYVQIITGVNLFVNIIFNSIVASIGDLCVKASDEDKYRVFKRIDFIGNWLSVFTTVCYMNMFNTFINNVWLRSSGVHTFEFGIVVAITISATVSYMRKPVMIFRDAMGLFKKDWYKPLIESVVGIACAIGLSFVWGVFGVVIGYVIPRVVVAMPIETWVLYKYGLHKNFGKYMLLQYLRLIFNTALGIGIYYLCGLFNLKGIWDFAARTAVSLVLPNIILLLIFIKSDDLKYFLRILKSLVNKVFKRKTVEKPKVDEE